MKLFLSQIFLYMLLCIASLCVGCRSSRTGLTAASGGTREVKTNITGRTVDKSSLYGFSFLRTDSLHIKITEYYPPEPGDTACAGPVKSETTLRSGAVSAGNSSAAEAGHTEETVTAAEETDISHHEESRTAVSKTVPWQLILVAVAAVAIIVYIILRRMHIV
jgi:hypothetical protein